MKRFLFSLLFIFGSFSIAFSQEQQPAENGKEQKIKALYVAYLTQELKLNETEAQKFWPLHAQFDGELKAVNISMPELERQQSILNIKKKYEDRFTKILGNNRTNDFYRKDGEFRKKLVEHLRKVRQQNNPNRQGNRRNF